MALVQSLGVAEVKVVATPVCGTGDCGFESRLSPLRAGHQLLYPFSMTDQPELTITQVGDIIDHISQRAYAGEWDLLNTELKELKFLKFGPDAIVAWARATAPLREKLPYWPEMIKRFHRWMSLQIGPERADRLFNGLLL